MEQFEKKIRYELRRLALVDAIISSSECPGITFCTAPDCCLDLGRLSNLFGLGTIKHFDTEDEFQSDRCLEYWNPLLVSETAAQALAILDFQHQVKRYSDEYTAYDLLIEVKPDIPLYLWGYVEKFVYPNDLNDPELPQSRQNALKHQIAFCLVSIAFPDSYLDIYDNQVQGDDQDLEDLDE